ncbi:MULTISPECIES: MurR/RpiR family transcriptional regulator [unclassified Lysinibacillus]|uniref:MurR/RpiR family transcriptional regulator n=1 Tax=unclassified Lysinibacillus TaxID=2636778 RepID=UPI0038098600
MDQILFEDQHLTPNEKTIADFIAKMGMAVLMYTEDEIAKSLQISNATVSRFWRKIGFKNFKDYKNSYKETMDISPANKLGNIMEQVSSTTIHAQMMTMSVKHLELTLAQNNAEDFQKAVQSIAKAKTIYIYSPGPSEGLGNLLNYRLSRFGFNIKVLPKSGHEIYESLLHFSYDDALFMFGFVKLHPESRVLLEHAKKLGMKSTVITDSIVSDFNMLADILLFASRGELWEFHSMIAPTFLVENIIIAVGKETGEQSMMKLEMLDTIRKEYKDLLPR